MDVDGGANAALLDVRLGALIDLELADDFRRQSQIVERARGGELIQDEPVRSRDIVTVEQSLGEVRRGAANADSLALTELAVDDDARYTLERLGDILVRKLADVFGSQDVGNDGGIALRPDRCGDRPAETGDDDVGSLSSVGRSGLSAARWRCVGRRLGRRFICLRGLLRMSCSRE